MVHTRAQRRVGAAAEHNMTMVSATLPDELLLRVLELVMLRGDGRKRWRGAVRVVSRVWRALHDGACTWLHLRNGVTDELMHALCGRLPALKTLILYQVTSLSAGGLRAMGGLTALTFLNLYNCTNVTDVGLQHCTSLTALSTLILLRTSTTQAGRNALQTALPALDIRF